MRVPGDGTFLWVGKEGNLPNPFLRLENMKRKPSSAFKSVATSEQLRTAVNNAEEVTGN